MHAFLLLDLSASMSGAALESLKSGVHLLCATFISRSKKPVLISLIGYESAPREILPLTDVHLFETHFDKLRFEPGGSSGLGGALRFVANRMPDHDPTLVYIFTDGEPTDDWETELALLRFRVKKVFALMCGLAPDHETLSPAVDGVFRVFDALPDMLFETFRAFA